MKTTLNPFQSLHARRLIVAVAITGAAAAVAAAVVMSDRPARGEISTRASMAELFEGTAAVETRQPSLTRSPKDAWRQLPPPWANATAISAPSDSSLPDAADVLGGAPIVEAEASPTY